MSDPARRRFNERETSLILGRAADMETWSETLPAASDFTLDDLVEIGAEVGLAPEAIQRAAALVPSRPGPAEKALLGTAAHPTVRARFPGRLPRSRYGTLTDLLDRTFGRRGTTEESDDRYAWTEEHGPGRTSVEVVRRGDETEVLVEADRRGWAILLFLGAAVGSIGGVLAAGFFTGLLGSLGLLTALAAPLAVAATAVRLVFPRIQGGASEEVQRAALHAGDLVATDGDTPLLPEESGEAAGA